MRRRIPEPLEAQVVAILVSVVASTRGQLVDQTNWDQGTTLLIVPARATDLLQASVLEDPNQWQVARLTVVARLSDPQLAITTWTRHCKRSTGSR